MGTESCCLPVVLVLAGAAAYPQAPVGNYWYQCTGPWSVRWVSAAMVRDTNQPGETLRPRQLRESSAVVENLPERPALC